MPKNASRESASRLLIVNNLPVRYRIPTFDSLLTSWHDKTGGVGHVAFQARRDPRRRGEWFFSQDADISFDHTYLSRESVAAPTLTLYRPALGLRLLQKFRPTHMFVAGWDTPAALACASYAQISGNTLVLWVESNKSTTRRTGQLARSYRRLLLDSCSGVVVPTAASLQFITSLTTKVLPAVILPNPVAHERLSASPARATQKRMIFVGEMTRRKGFDTFIEACRIGRKSGWTGAAWGEDRELLGKDLPDNCEIREARPIEELIEQFTTQDIWTIPSRRDPAPLTYSEAIALGMRVTISDATAYSEHARRTQGVDVHQQGSPESLVESAEELFRSTRPTRDSGIEVGNQHWASEVTDLLLGGDGA